MARCQTAQSRVQHNNYLATITSKLGLICLISISSFQVGYNINLGTIVNPDSEFPSAVSKMLQGIHASFHTPLWMFDVSMFPFQYSVINAIKFLRSFAMKVIEERCLALKNNEETPKDVLEHILNEAKENPEFDMEDLVDNFLTIFIAGT